MRGDKMPKHTAGPWEYEPKKDNYQSSIEEGASAGSIVGNGWHIARIWPDGWEDEKELLANAHLIAASPTMYEALQEMVEAFCNPNSYDAGRCISAEKQARAALTTATGGTNETR